MKIRFMWCGNYKSLWAFYNRDGTKAYFSDTSVRQFDSEWGWNLS